uniref:helix-turn-helix domain-containing protein n=1 Tax=Stenotrophomonas maltophilia TaxID=40324 RepID=UPI0019539A80
VQQRDAISNLLDNRINHEEGRFPVKTDYEVPALKRIHDVLEILCAATSPVRPAALAQATGMSRSTLYLLLE